jgi:alkanesulfonate monooxygenase SsuD/methylene tetrahydromethanopterin reductase-like flavin-dependent oxidoreductase (luciferase family)
MMHIDCTTPVGCAILWNCGRVSGVVIVVVALGLVLPMWERPPAGDAPSWVEVRALACRAEELGADTVWLADEILWREPDWPDPIGWWDCLTMAGAVAASTSTVNVGSWVMSAVQHKPGMIARAAESLDEISGGRFILGLGAGHGGGAESFGFDADRTVPRYLEALEILVPLLRGDAPVTFAGEFHRATNAEVRPRGPRAGRVPLMMGGHSPRTMTAAAQHADVWSAFATTSSLPEAFAPMTDQLDRICVDIGRDPLSIGRSVGVFVEPDPSGLAERLDLGVPITGSVGQIIDTIAGFADVGVTRVEIHPLPHTMAVLEKLAPVYEALT